MTGLRPIARILIVAIAGMLSSCIDCREEYWLHADGSGRAELIYTIPAAAAAVHGGESGVRDMITAFLKQTPQFTTSTLEVATKDKRIQVKLNATFDSALDLKDIISGDHLKTLPAAATSLIGDLSADIRGRSVDFSRKISPSKALPGSAFLPASQYQGHRLHYIMHLPAVPTDSNATRIEDGGRTLVWDIPLATAIRTPPVMRFKMDIPIPWKFVSAIAILISLASGGFIFLRIRKSRNRFPVGNPQISVL
jgi:hypothetical protein